MCIALIDIYRLFLSGILGGRCRFSPSCSCYAREAFEVFGFWRGLGKTLLRLSRCHPGGRHGYDPVVEVEEKTSKSVGAN